MTSDQETVPAVPTPPAGVSPIDPSDPLGADAVPVTELWVERTGRRTYTGRSSRGAEVHIGPVDAEAVFTPGELLKIALAGCTGMSVDSALAHRLGDDVPVTLHVQGQSDPEEDLYPALAQELVVDMSALDTAQRERLLVVVRRAVDLHCTVGRTLERGATVELTIAGER